MENLSSVLQFPVATRPALAARLAGEDFDHSIPHIQVHCKFQRCLTCGSTHRWSETYECITQGKTRKFLPCRSPSAIPIDYQVIAVEIQSEPTVACHECIGSRPVADVEAHRRWQATLMRKQEEAKASTEAPSRAGKSTLVVTEDML